MKKLFAMALFVIMFLAPGCRSKKSVSIDPSDKIRARTKPCMRMPSNT
jgi:hypothetical protein